MEFQREMFSREKGFSRERNPYPNSNSKSNSNQFPNSNPNSSFLSTIFVSNLPLKLDVFGLRGICSKIGRVEEALIPNIQKGRKRFGFVKFANHVAASKSLQVLNNKSIRGFRLWVQFARRDLYKVGQDYPSTVRFDTRSVPKSSLSKQKGEEDGDLLALLKKSVAVEVANLEKVRKALDALLGKIEEIIDTKSDHYHEGVRAEADEKVNGVAPNSNPSHSISSPLQASPKPSFVDALIGNQVFHSMSCNDVVVVDSLSQLPQPNPFLPELEEGEVQASGFGEVVGDSMEVESVQVVVAGNVFESMPPGLSKDINAVIASESLHEDQNMIVADSFEEVNRNSSLEIEEALDISSEIKRGLEKRGKKLEAKKKKIGTKMGKVNRFLVNTRRMGGTSKKVVESASDNTTNSIKEKARRAVDFGNLAGLEAKNKEVAVKRITKALKEHKKD